MNFYATWWSALQKTEIIVSVKLELNITERLDENWGLKYFYPVDVCEVKFWKELFFNF